jgi:hypothetical protein
MTHPQVAVAATMTTILMMTTQTTTTAQAGVARMIQVDQVVDLVETTLMEMIHLLTIQEMVISAMLKGPSLRLIQHR